MPRPLTSRGRSRGVSLVELMVASVIMGLVLSSALTLMFACYRHFLDGDIAAEMNDMVLSATTTLRRELADGHRASSKIFNAPGQPYGIVFASARLDDQTIDFDDVNLQPIWQKWVCYYLQPDDHDFLLIRKEAPLLSPTTTPPLVPADRDTSYFKTLDGGRVVARGVVEFKLEDGHPLKLGLTCRQVGHRGTSTESEFLQEIATQVTFRN